MTDASDDVFKPSLAYERMAAKWKLVDDLLGGTATMRAAGATWLPVEQAESSNSYAIRLGGSYLYGALSDTVEKFVGKPFSRAVAVKGEVPDALIPIEKDADLCGSSLTEFLRSVFRDGLQHGLSHMMPSYPDVGEKDGNGVISTPNLYQETQAGVRPYLQHIPAANVIGWRWKPGASGAKVLTQIRVRESRMEDDGLYGEAEAEYVRVYTPQDVELFKKGKDGKVESRGKVPHNLGKIPLVTYYVRPTGFMTADPPFEDLAWLNLEHWNASSDYNNIMHFALVPFLFGTGFEQEEMEKPVEIGANRLIRSKNSAATLRFVEPEGVAIPSGQKRIEAIEARMEVLGLSPAMENLANQTATARGIDDGNAKTAIQGWIRTLEARAEDAYAQDAEMVKQPLPEDFSVDIFQDFSIGAVAQQNIAILDRMRARGDISLKRFLYEVRRHNVIDSATDIDLAVEEAKAEGPPLGSMGFGAGEDEDEPKHPTMPSAAA